MPSLEFSAEAVVKLHELLHDWERRAEAVERVVNCRSLRLLETFPSIGPELQGEFAGHRFVLGPWRWLLIVYRYDEAADRVLVVTIQDSRSRGAATRDRR